MSFNTGDDLTSDLAEIVRDCPRRGEIWTETEWILDGDCRVAACGIAADGETFSVSGQVTDALAYYAGIATPPQPYVACCAKRLRNCAMATGRDWLAGGQTRARQQPKPGSPTRSREAQAKFRKK